MGISVAFSQHALVQKQLNLKRWGIPTAHYSGIAPLGEGRYAVVSDKEASDGFFVFRIEQDSLTGKVKSVSLEKFCGVLAPARDAKGLSLRDCEGIAYFPAGNSLFISGEGDQRIVEYDSFGVPTGRELAVPDCFAKERIVGNYGFEALTYAPETALFWTTTEAMLPADGVCTSPRHPEAQNLLRLQSFGADLQPAAQYAYKMDGAALRNFGAIYAKGLVALTALPDGDLLVLEREANIKAGKLGSKVENKVFRIRPQGTSQINASTDLSALDDRKFLAKELVARFATRITPFKLSFANYEGMCLGRKLADGRQTVLLINDSQAAQGRKVLHLRDYIKVLVLKDKERE